MNVSTQKYFPDVNIIFHRSESFLKDIQPFYKVFLSKIRKSGMANLADYIRQVYYSDLFFVDENKIKEETKTIPLKDNHSIRELAQQFFRNTPEIINEEKVKHLTEKFKNLTIKEKAAFNIVNIIIIKVIINEVLSIKNSRIFNSFIKPFLLQYYNECNSMSMRYKIPQEIIEHIDRIVAPDFDIVLEEFVNELHNPNFYYCKYSLRQLENLKQLLVKERAINDMIEQEKVKQY